MGEGATGTVAISAVTGLVVVIVMLGGAACGIVLFAAGLQQLAIAVIAIDSVAAVIVVSIVSSALTEIFRVAVYQYAVTESDAGRVRQRAAAERVRRAHPPALTRSRIPCSTGLVLQ